MSDPDRAVTEAVFLEIDKAAADGAACGCHRYSAGMTVVCEKHGRALMAPYTNLASCSNCGKLTHRPHSFSRARVCGHCDTLQGPD